MDQKVEVHVLAFNEAGIIPYTIRHYLTYASRIVLHDLGSKDATAAIAKAAGCEVILHDAKGEFNDLLNKGIKNECWKKTDADVVIVADADEMLYFPAGVARTLKAYQENKVVVVKPHGFEMTSDVYPTTTGQIYDEVKMGGPDDEWYAKPIMFFRSRVKSLDFGTGAHVVTGIGEDGTRFTVTNQTKPTVPPCYLLHFHHIGPIEKIAAEYDANRARQSTMNRQMKWGLQEPGMDHALKKRARIHAGLMRVIP
jgi:glycosyltransferase involved in cell wall biosynthesis